MLMDNINILEKLMNTLVALNRERTLQVCKEALTAHRPEDVIEALSEGLSIIGNKFETHEYFLSELMMAGVIMKDAQTIIRPHLTKEVTKRAGKVVIGTVEGDLHDIGKNITIALLEGKGFEVIDLGVNVPKSTFVQSVREEQPDVVGLSALLRATVPEMGQVITALQDAGLRDKVTVIVGGLPLNEDYAKKLGADYYAKDAWKGVEIIMQAVAPT
jgi:5-methyltetrahydrofolate--homocysteine methyltransferase